MAARPFLTGLRAVYRSSQLPGRVPRIAAGHVNKWTIPSTKITSARFFHGSVYTAAEAPGAPDSAQANQPTSTATPEPFDAKHAAFLGEADSNDGFEAAYEINPPKLESLDAANSAFLGEADSDDGFEAHRTINPPTVEALDATASAFLGEADSDDGFEGHRVVNPMDHGPIDPSTSAFHGESGEHDQ
jgi:hypothetical protein